MYGLDWKLYRPHREWVFIKADQAVKKTRGGLHIPDGTQLEKLGQGSGVILKVGSAASEVVGTELLPGLKVCFRAFLKDATAHEFSQEDGCPVFLIHAGDIEAVLEDDVVVT